MPLVEMDQNRRWSTWPRWARITTVIVGIIFVFALLSSFLPDAGASSADGPPIAVKLDQLEREFDANEVGAIEKYKGKPILVLGTVSSVTLDGDDNAVVQLESEGLLPVHAGILEIDKPAVGQLSNGQRVTLLCAEISEVLGKPVLDRCKVA